MHRLHRLYKLNRLHRSHRLHRLNRLHRLQRLHHTTVPLKPLCVCRVQRYTHKRMKGIVVNRT